MAPWNGLLERLRPKAYGRRSPLVLLNGLAEQHESWFRNRRFWGRYFDLYLPNILVYDGTAIHDRIAAKQPIDIDYLVGQLKQFVDQYVQNPPYHLVSSSLGGKIAVEFAIRYPHLVNRMVLICPSGMGDEEKLPIRDGIAGDAHRLVHSVFHKPRFVDRDVLRFYKRQMADNRWKKGLLRTVRGTMDSVVRPLLKQLKAQTLLITGAEDKVCDPKTAAEAAVDLSNGHFLEIPKCGHAPQIERHWLVNRLVVHYLTASNPSATPRWSQLLLAKPPRVTS